MKHEPRRVSMRSIHQKLAVLVMAGVDLDRIPLDITLSDTVKLFGGRRDLPRAASRSRRHFGMALSALRTPRSCVGISDIKPTRSILAKNAFYIAENLHHSRNI
jgi:hypothetical protein